MGCKAPTPIPEHLKGLPPVLSPPPPPKKGTIMSLGNEELREMLRKQGEKISILQRLVNDHTRFINTLKEQLKGTELGPRLKKKAQKRTS